MLLGLYLLPLTFYFGVVRPVPVLLAKAGAGLDNCGVVVLERKNPLADPAARDTCRPHKQRALAAFVLLATVNVALPAAGAVVRRRAVRPPVA
jgi:hypothetical protein